MGKKRVIFYLIDGARPDTLQKYIDEGYLPNIQKHLIDEGGFSLGTTCFPSTTGPAYLPFLTGATPGDHDITGIRWFDKKEFFDNRWKRSAMRSYCGYEAKYIDEDLNPAFPSLFEEVEHGYNIYNFITKGVKEENDLAKKGKSPLYLRAHFLHDHHVVDELGHQHLLRAIENDFDFIFIVFPSIDWDSHTYHYEDEKTRGAYQIIDKSIGELHAKLTEKGIWNDTLLIMSSDHGLSSTHSHLDLGKFFKQNGYKVLEYPNIMSISPKVAIFISGNSFASVHFLDKQALYEYKELMANHEIVLQNLVNDQAIDFIAMRKEQNKYIVMNAKGTAEIVYKNNKFDYHPITSDPFGLGEVSGWTFQEALENTIHTDYPDALAQVHQLFQSDRSGDIAISAKTGYDLRDFWELPEHKGSHGSMHWEHMRIPVIINKKGLLNEVVRSTETHGIMKTWLRNNEV